ncbi:MAG: hypothetical protein Q8M44_03770 [bacterium]|nr:hypothetical protein [bacterium]
MFYAIIFFQIFFNNQFHSFIFHAHIRAIAKSSVIKSSFGDKINALFNIDIHLSEFQIIV